MIQYHCIVTSIVIFIVVIMIGISNICKLYFYCTVMDVFYMACVIYVIIKYYLIQIVIHFVTFFLTLHVK